MENLLKARLNKSINAAEHNYSDAHVISAGNLHSNDIITEIIKDGLTVDPEIILDIITRFNRKASELVLSGYNVTTGLVTMNAEIKGSIHNKKWNPETTKISVLFKQGADLLQEIKKTKVEIMENEIKNNEIKDMNQSVNSASVDTQTIRINDRYLHINNDTPACGVAFRRWLCKA